MPAPAAESAVRDYLRALQDPASLRDDDQIKLLTEQLSTASDGVERLRLRQSLMDAETPSLERHEEGFITHAKAWADEQGISARAFSDEGVSPDVLRRAGFNVGDGRRRGRAQRSTGAPTRMRRSRVSAEDVRSAIPSSGTFTIKTLQDASGASPAVVRKVVSEEAQAGRLISEGTDPDHHGPGRAPTLYRRA
jgi:hypothetical protein